MKITTIMQRRQCVIKRLADLRDGVHKNSLKFNVFQFATRFLFAMSAFSGSLPSVDGPASGPDWWRVGRNGHPPPWGQALIWAALRLNEALDLELTAGQIAGLVSISGEDGGAPGKYGGTL